MWGIEGATEEGQTPHPSEKGDNQRCLLFNIFSSSSLFFKSFSQFPPKYLSPLSLVTFEEKGVLEAGVVFHGCWRHYGRSFILKHKSWCLALISPHCNNAAAAAGPERGRSQIQGSYQLFLVGWLVPAFKMSIGTLARWDLFNKLFELC